MVGRAEGPTQSTQCQWPRRCNSSCPLPTICHPEPLQALAGRFGKCQFLPWCNPVFSKVESLHVTTTIFAISTRDQALLFLPYDRSLLLDGSWPPPTPAPVPAPVSWAWRGGGAGGDQAVGRRGGGAHPTLPLRELRKVVLSALPGVGAGDFICL